MRYNIAIWASETIDATQDIGSVPYRHTFIAYKLAKARQNAAALVQEFELLRRVGGEHVLHNVHGQHVYVDGRAHEDQGLVLFVAADQVNVERHKKVADLEIGFFF